MSWLSSLEIATKARKMERGLCPAVAIQARYIYSVIFKTLTASYSESSHDYKQLLFGDQP